MATRSKDPDYQARLRDALVGSDPTRVELYYTNAGFHYQLDTLAPLIGIWVDALADKATAGPTFADMRETIMRQAPTITPEQANELRLNGPNT